MGKTALSKEDHPLIKNLLSQIEEIPESDPFKLPVDYQALGLHDYPQIIKNPMDISTIKKKLNKSKYTTFEEVFSDITLIWVNCKTYNMSDSPIYKMADIMEKQAKKLVNKLKQSKGINNSLASKTKLKNDTKDDDDDSDTNYGDENEDDENYISFSAKYSLSEKIKGLKSDSLTKLVTYLSEEDPESIDDLKEENRLQIRIDDIKKPIFDKVYKLVEDMLKENDDETFKPASKRQKLA